MSNQNFPLFFKKSEFSTLELLERTLNLEERRTRINLVKIGIGSSDSGEDVTATFWNAVSSFENTGKLVIKTYVTPTDKLTIEAQQKANGQILVNDGAAYINGEKTRVLVFRPKSN